MSALANRIDVHANAGLLLHQWQQAPRMRALVDALQGVLDDHLVKPLTDMEERTRIDTADGVWLDFIGERLMLPRPATDIANFDSFGFHGSGGVGFDQGPFATVIEALSPRVPVGDEYYRRLLTMRSVMLLGDSSVSAIDEAIAHLFSSAQYRDHGDMTVTLVGVPADGNLRAAVEAEVMWPSVAGVAMVEVKAKIAPLTGEIVHAIVQASGDTNCWQPAKVGHFETREIRDRERAW